jgi:hypothetical protein
VLRRPPHSPDLGPRDLSVSALLKVLTEPFRQNKTFGYFCGSRIFLTGSVLVNCVFLVDFALLYKLHKLHL